MTIANYYDSGRSTKGRGRLWKKKNKFGGVKNGYVREYGCVYENGKMLGSIVGL